MNHSINNNMLRQLLVIGIVTLCFCTNKMFAQETQSANFLSNHNDKGLLFGGYGEIVYQHFDYSDDFNRYTYPENYTDKVSRGQTDIPHLVFMIGYNFGNGWSLGTEIEIEHGGTGAAIELEAEEFGEYEQEVEKGGEIVLEQAWVQYKYSPAFAIRMGHVMLPIGATNFRHLPTQYFTTLRSEGESTILPMAWHETGVSLLGDYRKWHYELFFVNGLDVDGFGSSNWIQDGSASTYEYKLSSNFAGAMRVNHTGSIPGLRIGVSGYYGTSGGNSLKADRYTGITGAVSIGSMDVEYNTPSLIVRGNFLYGNITDTEQISKINRELPSLAPSPHTNVAKNAMCWSVEAGYNIFSLITVDSHRKLYPFARYEYYNSMENTISTILADARYARNVTTVGLNFFPINEIVIKAEYAMRTFPDGEYNQENTFNLGIMFSGMFD